jgi:hypothetical protein
MKIKPTIAIFVLLCSALLCVQICGAVQRQVYVQHRNDAHTALRFTTQGAWNQTLVVIQSPEYDTPKWDEFDANMCATDARFAPMFASMGFTQVRIGNVLRTIQK